MEDRIIGVKLYDPNFKMKFRASSFFNFNQDCDKSHYTFTTEMLCEDENCVLILTENDLLTEQEKLPSNIKAVVLVSDSQIKNPNIFVLDLPIFHYHPRAYPLYSFNIKSVYQKTNFLYAHEIETMAPHGGSFDNSCYALIPDYSNLITEAILKGCIPIILDPKLEHYPFFHYRVNKDNMEDTISALSPRSYFYESEHVVFNKSNIIAYQNPLDKIFVEAQEYIMKRKVIEIIENRVC